MAAPTPSSAHSAPPSTSPAPASAGAQYPTPSAISFEGMAPGMFPPPPAYPTFTHNGVSYVYIPVPVAFLPAQTHVTSRKRKRPAVPPPCTLCRLSRTPCVATRPGEACLRCIRKQVDCFDDGEATESPRLRHPPEDDGPEDVDSEPERDPNQPPLWQMSTNGYPPSYPPPPPSYPPTTASSTPIKRERATKACAECHARKRKCTGIGGPNCGSTGPRPTPANGAPSGSSARPSPRKSTPGGASGHTRVREPCADCRGRKRRCIHHSDSGASKDDGANGTDVDAAGDESMRTDHESDSLQPPNARISHRLSDPRSRSPARGSHSPPPGGRWQPHPPNAYYAQPPPQFSYPHAEQRMQYPHPSPGQFIHPSHGHENPYAHPPPPPHPHGLHPHPHPHARLPPAPDMRHNTVGAPGCKECRARGVTCTCPDTRAVDSASNAGSSSSAHTAAPSGPPPPTKGATPVPAATPVPPAGRKGRACLACRKLKMRCVAPSNANGENVNGNNNPDGPDERCQRCERAGLECIYVDRKRRGPGTVFGAPGDGTGSFEGYAQQANPNNGGANGAPVAPGETNGIPNVNGSETPSRPPAKKLKREMSPGAGGQGQTARNSPFPPGAAVPAGAGGERRRVSGDDALMELASGEDGRRDDVRMQRIMGEDAARALEETFADDDEEGAGGR